MLQRRAAANSTGPGLPLSTAQVGKNLHDERDAAVDSCYDSVGAPDHHHHHHHQKLWLQSTSTDMQS